MPNNFLPVHMRTSRAAMWVGVAGLLGLAGWVAQQISAGTAGPWLVGGVAGLCVSGAWVIGGGAETIQGLFAVPDPIQELPSAGVSTIDHDHNHQQDLLPPELAAWAAHARRQEQERSSLARDIAEVTRGRNTWAAIVVRVHGDSEEEFLTNVDLRPDRSWPLTVLAHYPLPAGGVLMIMPARDLQFGTRWLLSHFASRVESNGRVQMGVAVSPQDGRDPEALIRFARDAANRDEGAICFHDASTAKIAHLAEELALDARRALRDHEIIAHYQPIVSNAAGQIAGVEAFIRWIHPERGVLPAKLFVPGVDRSGVSLDMGAHVLSDAVGRTARWRAADAPSLFACLNVSEAQLRDARLLELITDQLASTNLPARALVLECAPLDLLRGWTEEPAVLNRLVELGITLWADVSEASLHDVRALGAVGVSGVKLPVKRFVGPTGLIHAEAIEAWSNMVEDLNWRLTIKNVETRSQLDALWSVSAVDFVQGRAICGPVPPGQIRAALHWAEPNHNAQPHG